MFLRRWMIRILLSLFFSAVSLIISFFNGDTLLLHYINTTFMIGLFFLVISGISLVLFSGFFNVFVLGWKKLFFKEDPYEDRNHWHYENKDPADQDPVESEKLILRKKAKLELVFFLPLSVSIILLIQSFLFLYFYPFR